MLYFKGRTITMAEDMRTTGSKALKNLSSVNNEKEIESQNVFKSCCKTVLSHYKIRRVTNKGAVLVLVLSFMATSSFYLLFGETYSTRTNIYNFNNRLVIPRILSYCIFTSIAGLLADAFIGRYKVIRISVWTMWIFMILATVSVALTAYCQVGNHHHSEGTILTITLSVAGMGLGGFQANIIQFGLDQLHDASTTEITSFTIWYTFTVIGAGLVVNFTLSCLNESYKPFLYLFVCLSLTVAVLIIMCSNHHFVKEPPTKNPFKLIFKVIRFAIKNKRLRGRSAFTYCEDDLPSRIDFGKGKYGGPFTIEEVEDVKTILRMLPIVTIFGLMISVPVVGFILDYTLTSKLLGLYGDKHHQSSKQLQLVDSLAKCYSKVSPFATSNFIVPLLIGLNETIIYPVFHKYNLICLPMQDQELVDGYNRNIFTNTLNRVTDGA